MRGDHEIDFGAPNGALVSAFYVENVLVRTWGEFGLDDGFFGDQALQLGAADFLRRSFGIGLPEKDYTDDSGDDEDRQNTLKTFRHRKNRLISRLNNRLKQEACYSKNG